MMRAKLFKTLLSALVLLLSVSAANAALKVHVDKELIPIDAFYKGGSLTINGSVDSNSDVIVKITSPIENESFMVKAKFYHLFWMNKDKVDIKKVNSVYMLYSSNDIDRILSDNEKSKYLLGYDAIRQSVGINGGSDKDTLFSEFIKVKEAGKLYSASEGNKVILIPSTKGKNSFWLTVKMPYQVPIGSYNIEVYAVSNKMVIEKAFDEVKIEPVGVVSQISDMSMTHGGLYGLLAIIIALATGYMVTPMLGIAKKIVFAIITAPKRILDNIGGQQLSAIPLLKETNNIQKGERNA